MGKKYGNEKPIHVTPAMIKAGEEALDRAFERACEPSPPDLPWAVRDVYIAMERARVRRAVPARARPLASACQDARSSTEK